MRKRIAARVAVAIAGAAFIAGGATAVVASGSQVQVTPATGFGYQAPPASYDVSGGPVTVTFSYNAKNQTSSAITADVELDANRITLVELSGVWTDVSTGYPALTELQIAAAVANHQIGGLTYLPKQSQTVTLPAATSVTVTSTLQLSQCGYYQVDSQSVNNAVSGLFATGFIRVIGCTPAPSPSPSASPSPSPSPSPSGGVGAGGTATPTPTPTPTPTATTTPTPSPSPSPTGGVQGQSASPTPTHDATPTRTPTGSVLAISTPGTGTGPGAGVQLGLLLIGFGAVLLLGALVAGRRPEPI
jgi:hypothetical protein